MSEMTVYAIVAVRGAINGALIAYFLNEKKLLGVAAVLALVVLEVMRCAF